MRRSLILLCLCPILALPVFASPVRACLNDRETSAREREFKSQYQPEPSSTSPAREESAADPQNIVMSHPGTSIALGGTMALAGLTLGFSARRRKV